VSASGAPAWIETADGSLTLLQLGLDETYHSTSGAWAEAKAVFLEPWLSERASQSLETWRVLDVGFGLGLNWLAFATAAERMGRVLEIISIEHDASLLHLEEPRFEAWLTRTLGAEACYLRSVFVKDRVLRTSKINARLVVQDAAEALADLADAGVHFDVILQDAFSPKKNSECWDAAHFSRVAKVSAPGCRLFTYSVAKSVREALSEAGFIPEKYPGFGKKRERLMAVKT